MWSKKMQDLKWVRSNHKTDWPFMTMLSISLYLLATADSKIIWGIFALSMTFGLLNNPKLILVGFIIFCISMVVHGFFFQTHLSGEIDGEYKVIKSTAMGPIIKYKGNNVLLKYFGEFNKGETIYVTGSIYEPVNTNDFDLVTYLRSMNVSNIVLYPKIEFQSESTYFLYKFIRSLELGADNYSMIAPLLLLGENGGISRSVYDMALEMNVVHLFVISGFHISLMYRGIRGVLFKATKNEYFSDMISFTIPIFYLLLLDFSLSSTRAGLLIMFSIINNHWLQQRFTSLERLSFVCILMFLFSPWSIYSLSFIFSFTATFAIAFVNTLKIKSVDTRRLLVFICAYASTIPISIYINGYFSVFGLLFGIGLGPLFAFYYVATLFLFPFPFILNYLYIPFIYMMNISSSINWMITDINIDLYIIQAFYLLFTTCLIIVKLWNLFTEKNHTLLKENWSNSSRE